ncbi:hypothetical protein LSTR_LSTR017132 [Laodelphax striatellus]|uniref:Uncharacterized protein n=1 Tax=Laodelphax striatellus TaxID=195883 RepID=A0A482XPL4_LAOST|nr:hypothetical protein LSTR_LSTR017132 [Laodelphax striatellus]
MSHDDQTAILHGGPDYDSSCEYEIALEHARLCRLLQEWEAAKQRSARCRAAQSSKAPRCYLPAAAAAANGDAMAAQRHATALQWYHHQQPSLQQYYQPPPPHYQFSNSVVMYDKSRGHYYTELA